MEFTPSSAPVYGGGLIILRLPLDYFIEDGARFFFVFEGTTQRQITEAKLDDNKLSIKAVIPDHEPPEELDLSLILKSDKEKELRCLMKDSFTFYLDQTCYLARYLADSVHVFDGLENWDDIQGPQFSLEHEEFETLDERLTSAFEHLILPLNWSLLGDPTAEEHRRETLFHFAARLGLTSFVTLLMDKNGAEECLRIRNKHGSLAHDIARDRGYHGLADLMIDPHAHGVIRWKSTQRITDFTVIKRHSFGTISTSSEVVNGNWPPIESEFELLSGQENSPMQDHLKEDKELYKNNAARPELPPKPTSLYSVAKQSVSDESDFIVGDYDDYENELSVKYADLNEPHNRNAILGDSLQQLQELSDEVQQMHNEEDVANEERGARLSISCPDLGQDIMLVSAEYLNYDDDESSTATRENEDNYFDPNEVDEQPSSTEVSDVEEEEAILRPHSWHLNHDEQPVSLATNRLSAPNLTHKRSRSMVNSSPSQEPEQQLIDDDTKQNNQIISPAVRRVRRHNNHTFAVVGSQNDISAIGRDNSASINNNNNIHDDRRYTISEGVLSPAQRKSLLSLQQMLRHDARKSRTNKRNPPCDTESQSSDEQEMSLSEFLSDPTNFENINSKPPVPPPPDKNKVSRKLSFLSKMRNSTRMRPKEKFKKATPDGKIIAEEKVKQSIENVSDSRENLREPAWINNVKNRVKKSSNAQKPQNMLINKLPNYTSSLPNSSFASLQGQSKTLSTMELAQKLNNDGNSSETSEKRLSGYADDESISYQSGMYTPPNSSTQLSSMRENSSSAEHLGDLQYYSELKKDPDLSLGNDNPETWSMTVDKKLLKKMNKKDMKRQENIYEFFQKEQNFLTTLKIMQKIFAQGMRLEANIDDTVISTMFPQIDEFVEYTNQFMVKLRQRQEKRDDKVVDEIGDLLVEQWSGESARQMIDLFSQICCEQNEIVALYKDLLKSDKKFNDFIETSRKNPLTRRRGIQECLLLVTQRITKYQIMVKSLIDNSSDKKYKKDVENLQKALECVTGITVAVNSRVQEHEKLQMLKKIWKSMESKVITYNETRKFSKDDLLQQMRHLEHYAHNIQWKSKDSKKIVDVTMLLFTDCLVLLHESNQRYSFASNGQPAVVPLHKLIVRDIANEQQGFYLISAGSQVEMYTLYCDSEESCKNWMQYIRTAAQNCPEEDEGIQTEEERKQEQKWIEAHAMINELEVRDKKINALLEEKMENFRKLAALSNKAGLLENMQFRYPTHSWVTNDLVPPGTPVLLQAIDQVAKLTHAIHGPGGVARHPSSVGEGESGSYTPPVLPKRSGTFGGFDNGAKELQSSPKLKVLPKDFEKESIKESRKRDSGLIMTDFTVGSPDMNENELEEKVTEPPGGKLPLLDHQVTSLAQLTHLLNQYLSIATQQDTQMEIIKLELEQAKDKPHSRRRQTSNLQEVEALRYKSKQQQQEQELSKQQTQLMMDKMAWNKEIEQRKNTLDVTENEVNERITTVKKREEELEKEQEEVKKMKDDLQREMARLRELQKRTQNQEQGISTHTSVPTINHNNSNNQDHDIYRHSSDVSSDKIYKNDFKSTSPTYNSASDYPRTFPVGKRESGVIFPPHNTIGGTSTSSLFPQQQNLPIHLQYSATNQATALQHTNTQIPGKLSKLAKKSSAPNSVSNIHQVIPNKLSGLSKSGGVNASKPGHNSKFADGIKHKIPFGHSKHQSKTDDSSYLKHSKSETNVGNRLRPTSAYDSSTTEVDSSAVERSNSASSNSSKEGSEKKKKKHSSNESDKSRSKETKEVFYL